MENSPNEMKRMDLSGAWAVLPLHTLGTVGQLVPLEDGAVCNFSDGNAVQYKLHVLFSD